MAFRNAKLNLPENPGELYEVQQTEAADLYTEKLVHTNQFKYAIFPNLFIVINIISLNSTILYSIA